MGGREDAKAAAAGCKATAGAAHIRTSWPCFKPVHTQFVCIVPRHVRRAGGSAPPWLVAAPELFSHACGCLPANPLSGWQRKLRPAKRPSGSLESVQTGRVERQGYLKGRGIPRRRANR